MGENPDRIRQEIAETRAQMEETVDAIGYKADVPARAKENVQGKVDSMTHKVSAVKDRIAGTGSDALQHGGETLGHGAEAAKSNARQVASVAQENPLGLAIGAAAVGFLGGMLVPSTRMETERLGPMADELRSQVVEKGHEVIEQGKSVAQDAAEAASEVVAGAAA